ncbi:MAG: Gldg family protein [Chromatiales bacterium]|jgi:ABC-type uncharacterized transport system involved in gliding motility auxiliary subunit|nr:Gldg family protein [Chromatiales bacterium]
MADLATGNRRTLGRIGLVVLAIGFIIAVAAVNMAFKGLRLDLTENRLYTLSEGTRNVLADIPEPVNVYFFWSDRATTSIPYLRSYAARVREMLEEFASRSNGKLRFTVVDPQPFSEDEDRAAQFGLQPANLPTTPEPVYLGIAGTNSVGDQEIIPFLDPGKEQFLEYDLAKLVYSLAKPKKPVIGLLSGLPMMAGFDPMTQQMREPYAIAEQLQQLFELRVVGEDQPRIDDEVQVLLVVHPKELTDAALYAIDQFVLRGGRAFVFVDPFAEIDPGNPMEPPGPGGSKASDLGRLLDAWGVTVDTGKFVADDRFALTVGGLTARPVRHLGIIGVDQSAMDQDDVVTGGLGVVNLAFAGHIARKDGATIEVTPLIRSSESAALIPTSRLAFLPDPSLLRDDFAPTDERYTIAARLTGTVRTAFPDGPPAGAGGPAPHLTESAAPVDILLVADADVVADRLWVQNQNFLGQRISQAFANNGDLVINGVDNLLGSSDLISIRSRATFSRPFDKVLELRRAAEARLVQSEEALQQELRDTEARLSELQAARQDGGTGSLLLSPEQQREIDRFQARRLDIRKELRQVQRSLDQDIERLGNRLKAINIAGIPLLISLLSLGLYLGRRRRSRAAPEVQP